MEHIKKINTDYVATASLALASFFSSSSSIDEHMTPTQPTIALSEASLTISDHGPATNSIRDGYKAKLVMFTTTDPIDDPKSKDGKQNGDEKLASKSEKAGVKIPNEKLAVGNDSVLLKGHQVVVSAVLPEGACNFEIGKIIVYDENKEKDGTHEALRIADPGLWRVPMLHKDKSGKICGLWVKDSPIPKGVTLQFKDGEILVIYEDYKAAKDGKPNCEVLDRVSLPELAKVKPEHVKFGRPLKQEIAEKVAKILKEAVSKIDPK